jgi:hypothetical protein
MRELPPFRDPFELSDKLREVGKLWASSKDRPRVQPDVKRHWEVTEEIRKSELGTQVFAGRAI